MVYLKDGQYYSDLYDLLTIKRCLDHLPPENSEASKVKTIQLVSEVSLYYVTGERYKNKSQTINQWMYDDKEKDERVKNAHTPFNIRCSYCSTLMDMTMKELHYDNTRVMLWFECPNCKKRKVIFDNGEEYKSEPNLCPKCSSVLTEKFERKDRFLTTNIFCPNCKYKTHEIIDFEKEEKEWNEKQKADSELLAKYRNRFCLSEKEGSDYIEMEAKMVSLSEHLTKREQIESDPAYQKVMQLKKLTVRELEKLLSQVLEENKYIKLVFNKPEIDKYVIIPFTVQETDSSRNEFESKIQLQRIVKKSLKETNWRLMSEGVDYRLGYISGRLKGYEREEDLIKIVKSLKT